MNKRTLALLGLTVLMQIGCGESKTSAALSSPKTAHIEGVVANRNGPITQGTIRVSDSKQQPITSLLLDAEAKYVIDLPAATAYPVFLRLETPGEDLEAVIIDASVVHQDLTHISTLVVQSAKELGGITPQNMARAATNAIAQSRTPAGRNTTAGFNGDPTKQYGGWH